MNIRNEADRAKLEAKGFNWVTVCPRGDNKGEIRSKHRTHEAADRAARGLDRKIINVADSAYF